MIETRSHICEVLSQGGQEMTEIDGSAFLTLDAPVALDGSMRTRRWGKVGESRLSLEGFEDRPRSGIYLFSLHSIGLGSGK